MEEEDLRWDGPPLQCETSKKHTHTNTSSVVPTRNGYVARGIYRVGKKGMEGEGGMEVR